MVPLASLWLPILLSAVIVFFASFVMHTVLTYHRSDYKQLPDEDRLLATLRSVSLKPGTYVLPYCLPKEMKTPAAIEKYKQGPVGFLSVMPSGPPALPKFLVKWFIYSVVVGFFTAYVTAHTVAVGAHYLAVFRVAGTVAFMAYGLGEPINAIWRGQTGSATLKAMIDGLIYGLLTAGTFGWLWPR
ncbi:MAG TPA: hypothetical protein VGF06_04680 [Terriglobales bacterium]|jgi:hypothetical protein